MILSICHLPPPQPAKHGDDSNDEASPFRLQILFVYRKVSSKRISPIAKIYTHTHTKIIFMFRASPSRRLFLHIIPPWYIARKPSYSLILIEKAEGCMLPWSFCVVSMPARSLLAMSTRVAVQNVRSTLLSLAMVILWMENWFVRFDGYREYPVLAGEAFFDQSRESEAVGQPQPILW